MSLRSGRVGVNPEDVNPINGKIQVEAPDNVYTKTQADNKFETKTHAGNTYLTKTEAEALQPINLAVPIPLLNGSALTVETGLQGIGSEVSILSSFIKNIELSSADDIDTIVNSGVYAWADSVPAHAPGNNGYCTLIHTKAYGGAIYRAIQICIRTTSSVCTMYTRRDAGSGWSAWFKVDLTENS